MAAAVVVGTVIGSGVFKKGQVVAEKVPEFGLAMSVWVLGGLLALLGALALAEVATLFPKAGGNYVFLKEGYGRLFGFLWGWVDFWIIRSASIAALASMFAESFQDVLRQTLHTPAGTDPLTFWQRQALTVSVILGLAWINSRGTKIGGAIQVILTTVKVGSLLGIIALPFVVLAITTGGEARPDVSRYQPVWPDGVSGIHWGLYGSALVGVLWAYHGWMNIGPIAEEVREPQRNLPIAVIGGVCLLIGLYVGVNAAYYSVIPQQEMAELKGTTVATEFSFRLLGPIGAVLASAAVMISVFGSLNGNLLVGPRLLFAMGRDRLAPQALQRLHPTRQTPAIATAVMALWSASLVVIFGVWLRLDLSDIALAGYTLDLNLPRGKSPFDVVTDFAMFGAVTFETLAVATIFRFRMTMPTASRPYRCIGYPLVPAVYVAIMTAVAANMVITPDQRGEAIIGLIFMSVGAVVYWLFGREK